MYFYWAGFLFWLLIVIGLVTAVYGIFKKSWKAFFISGLMLLPPLSYFSGANNGFRFLALLPLIPIVIALVLRKLNEKV